MWASRTRLRTGVLSLSLLLACSLALADDMMAMAANSTTNLTSNGTSANVTKYGEETPQAHHDLCRVHLANNTGEDVAGASRPKQLSSIRVLQAGTHAADVAVVLQVTHPDVSALEVTLTHASQRSRPARKTTIKAANSADAGMNAPNMMQTIFSDFAIADFPNTSAAAPFTGVYRPAQPLRSLVSDGDTATEAATSDGVWTLTVTDTRANATSMGRPLQIVGWELWLCGGEDGSFLVGNSNDVTKQDGAADGSSTASVVIRRSVAPSDGVLPDGTTYKLAADQAKGNAKELSAYIASVLPQQMQEAKAALTKDYPQISQALDVAIDKLSTQLAALPSALGFKVETNGTYTLNNVPDLALAGNIKHCFEDIYWCYSKTGLGTNLAVELAAAFEKASSPIQKGLAGQVQLVSNAISRFTDTHPGYGQWSDVMFNAAIQRLHGLAWLSAEASFFRAYAEAAVKYAIFITPFSLSIDPAIAVQETLNLIIGILRTTLTPLVYLPFTVDARINNRISPGGGLVIAAERMFTSLQDIMQLASQGLDQAAQMRAGKLQFTTGQVADSLKSINSQFEQSISSFSPAMGSIFKSVTDPLTQATSSLVGGTGQAALNAYFRQQANNKGARDEFMNSISLLGNITVGLANETANVLSKAQETLLPGMPMPIDVLKQIRDDTQSVMDSARQQLMELVPVQQLDAASQIVSATVDSVLATLSDSANQLAEGAPSDSVLKSLGGIVEGLRVAQADVANTFDAVAQGFPGPLLNSTLGLVKTQSQTTVNRIQDLFTQVGQEFPNLDPTIFTNNLNNTLEELLAGTTDSLGALSAFSPYQDTMQVASQVPDALSGVMDTLQGASSQLSDMVVAQTVTRSAAADGGDGAQAPLPAGPSPADQELLSTLQQATNDALTNTAARINALTRALPDQPALSAITNDITTRLSGAADALSAIAPALTAPGAAGSAAPGLLRSQLASVNSVLEGVLRDVQSQEGNAPALADALAAGPLGQAAQVLGDVTKGLSDQIQSARDALQQILPGPQDAINAILGPAQDALHALITSTSDLGVQALGAGSDQLLSGLQNTLGAVTPLLLEGQNTAASVLEQGVAGLLQLQDQARNTVGTAAGAGLNTLNTVTKDAIAQVDAPLQEGLAQLTPAPEQLLPLLRPTLAFLNDRVGNLSAVVQGALPDVQGAMVAAAGQLQDTAVEVGKQLVSLAAGGGLAAITPVPGLLTSAADLIGATITDIGNNLTTAMLALPQPSLEKAIAQVASGVADSAQTAQMALQSAANLLPRQGPILDGLLGNGNGASASLERVLQLTRPLADGTADPADAAAAVNEARNSLLSLLPAPQAAVGAVSVPVIGTRSGVLGQQLLGGLQQTVASVFAPLKVGNGRFVNAVQAGLQGATQALAG